MSGGIKIPVGLVFDKGADDQAIQEFTAKFNKLGDSIARAGKQKFAPIDRASVEDIRRVTSAMESLKRVSGDLNKRLRVTGQGKAQFVDIDWEKLYPDTHARARQMRKAFDYVTGDNRFSAPPSNFAPPAPGGGGRPPPPSPPPSPPSPPASPNYGRNIVSAGLNAAGPVGSVANGALSAGMAGGIGAGLAGLAGGLAALAIGKFIGSVREKISSAQQEFIGYDKLKRTLGDVNISFGGLRESLREAARGLDMTFEEGVRLGQQFTRMSGMSGGQYRDLGKEVEHGGGFARSFGLDPSQGNSFFAQMRLHRVTGSVDESRRLGLLIGEGVAKSGAFSQVDHVLEAIAGYTAQQTRMGMVSANVAGYAGLYSGMIGSGVPGMDPVGAATLLGRANSTFAAGGGAGEAGQNFLYTTLGSHLGLNPVQANILREQGLFGTGAATFGAGSAYARYAGKFGASVPGAAATSGATNLELVMGQLTKNYAGKPDLMIDAVSRLFGISSSQAAAFASVNPQQLGGLSNRLRRNGVNINDVNSTGISRIAQIEADGSLSEGEKDRRIKEAATQHQEETEGSRTRATINGVERAIQDMAGRMVPLMNDMRAGIMYMAGEGGKRSPREILEAIATSESKDRSDRIDSEFGGKIKRNSDSFISARTRRIEAEQSFRINGGGMSPEQRVAEREKIARLLREESDAQASITKLEEERKSKLEEEQRRLDQDIGAIRNPLAVSPDAEEDWRSGGAGAGRGRVNPSSALSSDQQTALSEQAQRYFVSKGWSRSQAAGIVANLQAESGLRHGVSGDGGAAYGLAQWHADRQGAFRDKFGKDIGDSSFEEQLAFVHHELTDGGERAAGSKLRGARTAAEAAEMVTRLYERPANPDADSAYRAGLAQRLEQVTPMGDGARGGDAVSAQRIEVSGTFNLNGPTGMPASAPVRVSTIVGPPRPQ